MRFGNALLLATTAAFGLSACSTTRLETRLDNVEPTALDQARKGVSYALPMRRYDIVITRRLAKCRVSNKDSPETFRPEIVFVTSATATSALVPGERYLIDYEALGSDTKTTDFKIEFHPGSDILKTVNASADDQTGDIIAKTAATIGTVALAVASPPAAVSVAAAALASQKATETTPGPGDAVPSADDEKPSKIFEMFLDESSWSARRVECADSVAGWIKTRDELTTELDRLESGSILTEWRQVDPIKPSPFGDSPTLAMVNDRLASLLPFIGMRPMPQEIKDDLTILHKWQTVVRTKAESKKAERDALDKNLSLVTKTQWPQKSAEVYSSLLYDPHVKLPKFGEPNEKGVEKIAGYLKISQQNRSLNVTLVPITIKKWQIEHSDHLDVLRATFPEFFKPFFYENGELKQAPPAPPLSCVGPDASVELCINESFAVRAALARQEDAYDHIAAPPAKTPKRTSIAAGTRTPVMTDIPMAQGGDRNAELFEITKAEGLKSADGLFIRPPVMAILQICPQARFQGIKCETNIVEKAEPLLVPQLGQLRLLPLVNGPFANNGLSVSLAEDGRLLSFAYMSKRAILAAMAASASDAATRWQTYEKDKQAKFDAAETRSRTAAANEAADKIAELQNQVTEKNLLKDLAPTAEIPEPTEIEKQIKKETEATNILKSKLLLLITQQCYIQADLNPNTPTVCPAD